MGLHGPAPTAAVSVWAPGVLVWARIYYRLMTKPEQRTMRVWSWNPMEIFLGLVTGLFWPIILGLWIAGFVVAWNPRRDR